MKTDFPVLLFGCCILCFPILLCQAAGSSSSSAKTAQEVLQPFGILEEDHVPFALKYSIFDGRSAIRNLPKSCQDVCKQNHLSKSAKALLLLLAGYGDAAHDVILGVTLENLDSAEYAATHRGQPTSWAEDHPLSDLDDIIHSLIHRMEGSTVGEGGHSGFENAKYWACGGPKASKEPLLSSCIGVVCDKLQELAKQHAPLCVSEKGLIRNMGTTHQIIAGGGTFRTVHVPKDCWDAICYIDLCQEESNDDSALQQELGYLHGKEMEVLLEYALSTRE